VTVTTPNTGNVGEFFFPGDDITSYRGSVANMASAFINNWADDDAATSTFQLTTQYYAPQASPSYGAFQVNDTIRNINPYFRNARYVPGVTNDPATYHWDATITQIQTDNYFNAYTAEDFIIAPSIGNSVSAAFTLAPREGTTDLAALPEGLILDSASGTISGKPTKVIEKSYITIKATNSEGSSTYTFALRVYAHLKFTVNNEDSSADPAVYGPTYMLHREGAHNERRACRITSDNINSDLDRGDGSHYTFRDPTCILEVEELDLYYHGLNLTSYVSEGMCRYLQYRPYYYYEWKPVQTEGLEFYHNNYNTCPDASVTAFRAANPLSDYATDATGTDIYFTKYNNTAYNKNEDQIKCYGDYTDVKGPESCDMGSYDVIERNYTCQASGVIPSSVPTTKKCDGKFYKCWGGPLTEETFSTGEVGKYTASLGGGEIFKSNYSAPAAKTKTRLGNAVYSTNRYLANYVGSNSCAGDSTVAATNIYNNFSYYKDAWLNYAEDVVTLSDMYKITDPFRGGHPFYTIECLDAAREIIGRIDLVVREWDRRYPTDRATYQVEHYMDYLQPDLAVADFELAHINDLGVRDIQHAQIMDSTATDEFRSYYNDIGDWDNIYPNSYLDPRQSSVTLLENCGTGYPFTAPNARGDFSTHPYGKCKSGALNGEYGGDQDAVLNSYMVNEASCKHFSSTTTGDFENPYGSSATDTYIFPENGI